MNFEEKQEIKVVCLNEICRACLIKGDNMKNLLESNEEVKDIITKLSTLADVEIELNDTFPCYLCNNCEEKLKISYDFQQLCQKSQQFLSTYLSANPVVDSFKLQTVEDNSENFTLPQLENNSDSYINFLDNEGLERRVLISYYPTADSDVQNINVDKNTDVLQEIQENIPKNSMLMQNVSVNAIKENVQSSDDIITEESFIKPPEVHKRTMSNQTMRLSQFSPEEVDKIAKKAREKFLRHVECSICSFTAKNIRALSMHMTRVHKQAKEKWCLWCNKSFDDIKEHMVIHKDDFKCPLCGKNNTNTGHFMEHLASHSIQRKFVCTHCGKCYISQRHLKIHSKSHAKQKHICQICSKMFMLVKSLNHHYIKHHKKHNCKICEEFFSTPEEYNSHKCFSTKSGTVREDESQTKCLYAAETDSSLPGFIDKQPQNYCKICNKKVRSLQIHLNKVHYADVNVEDKKPNILCSYCGKCFVSLSKLTVHIRTHTGEMPYKCSFCDKRMTARIHLVVHERTHTGEKPHVCKFCGKAFRQTSVLNTHMKLHTGRPEECSICHKRFCRPSELRVHMRTHTGERPYECHICGKEFAQRTHLAGHIRKHGDDRPYKCSYCTKSFKYSSCLHSHMNIHLGKRPYECPHCPYACRQNHSLKRHMLQHENEPKPEKVKKCEICGQCFTSFKLYSLHCNSEHGTTERGNIVKDNIIDASAAEIIESFQDFA